MSKTTFRPTDILRRELADCETAARREGFDGPSGSWEPTAADLESVCSVLGRKPTREEWAAAGYPGVGGAHVRPAFTEGDRVRTAPAAIARGMVAEEDADTGTVLRGESAPQLAPGPDMVYVAWSGGQRTWTPAEHLEVE